MKVYGRLLLLALFILAATMGGVLAGNHNWYYDSNTATLYFPVNQSGGETITYFLNTTSTYAANPDGVFTFYDDFLSFDVGAWTCSSGACSVSGSELLLDDAPETYVEGIATYNANMSLVIRIKYTAGNLFYGQGSGSTNKHVGQHVSGSQNSRVDGSLTGCSPGISSSLQTFEFYRNSTASTQIFRDGAEVCDQGGATNGAEAIDFYAYNTPTAAVDYVYVAKRNVDEPVATVTSLGGGVYKIDVETPEAVTNYPVRVKGIAPGGNIRITQGASSIPPNASVTAADRYTSGALTNFSVLWNETVYETTNGTVVLPFNISSDTARGVLWNLTYGSTEDGGYFNRTYTDINLSTEHTASLHQAEVTFYAENRVSGEAVTSFTVNTSSNGGSSTSTGTNPTLNLTAANNYVFAFHRNNYYDAYITGRDVAALEQSNDTFTVYNHILNLSIAVGGSVTDQNFTADVYSLNWSFHEKQNTTNGIIEFNLTPGEYKVFINDSIHTLENATVVLNNSVNITSLSIQTYTTNSLNITIRDADTGNLITSENITLRLLSSDLSFSQIDIVDDGNIFIELLSPLNYTLTASGPTYDERSYQIQILDQVTRNITVYLSNNTEEITFTVRSTTGPDLQGAVISMYQNVNGTVVGIASKETDAFGQAIIYLTPGETYLISVSKNGYTSFDGQFVVVGSSYTISLEPSSVASYVSPFSDVRYVRTVNYANNSINISFDITSASGILEAFIITTTYNGTTYTNASYTSPSGGIINLYLHDVNVTAHPCINITWVFDASGFSIQSTTTNHCFIDIEPSDLTIASVLGLIQLGTTGKAIIGMIILVLVVSGALFGTRNINLTSIAGSAATGVLTYYGLFPNPAGYVVSILVIVLVVAKEVTS